MAAGEEGLTEQFCVQGESDPRIPIDEAFKCYPQVRSEEEKTLWKNYFRLEAKMTGRPDPGFGTAFLTDLIRTYGGEEYAVLLTAAHNLHERPHAKKFPHGGLVPKIKLYNAVHLAQKRNFTDADPLLYMDMGESFECRKGWYVFHDSYPDQKMKSDYGAIFVKKKLMDAQMSGYGGLENSLIVSPREAPNPAKTTKAYVAGFPEEYGGETGKRYKKNHVLVFSEDGRLPAGAKQHDLLGITLHDATTSQGQSGCPYVVSAQSQHYAVGIHLGGAEKGNYDKVFGAGDVPQWLTKDKKRRAINYYKDIDDSLEKWVMSCHVPENVMDVGSGRTVLNTPSVSTDGSVSSHDTPGASEKDECDAPAPGTTSATSTTTPITVIGSTSLQQQDSKRDSASSSTPTGNEEFNPWDLVVIHTAVFGHILEHMDPEAVATKCVQKHLISYSSLNVINRMCLAGRTKVEVVNRILIDNLRGTGISSYKSFKQILGEVGDMTHHLLLRKINAMEVEVLTNEQHLLMRSSHGALGAATSQ